MRSRASGPGAAADARRAIAGGHTDGGQRRDRRGERAAADERAVPRRGLDRAVERDEQQARGRERARDLRGDLLAAEAVGRARGSRRGGRGAARAAVDRASAIHPSSRATPTGVPAPTPTTTSADCDHRARDPVTPGAPERRPRRAPSRAKACDDVEHLVGSHLRRGVGARAARRRRRSFARARPRRRDACEVAEAVLDRVDRGAEVGLDRQAEPRRDRGARLVGVDEHDGVAACRDAPAQARSRPRWRPRPGGPRHRDDRARARRRRRRPSSTSASSASGPSVAAARQLPRSARTSTNSAIGGRRRRSSRRRRARRGGPGRAARRDRRRRGPGDPARGHRATNSRLSAGHRWLTTSVSYSSSSATDGSITIWRTRAPPWSARWRCSSSTHISGEKTSAIDGSTDAGSGPACAHHRARRSGGRRDPTERLAARSPATTSRRSCGRARCRRRRSPPRPAATRRRSPRSSP